MIRKVKKKNCPFCQENISAAVFLESKNFSAIYNRAPILPGHSMVIPNWHVDSLLELDDKELCEMMVFSKQAVQVLMKTFFATGFNWTLQEGWDAGQTVPHLHIHLIPRSLKDLAHPGDWYPLLLESQEKVIDSEHRQKLSDIEMSIIVQKIKENL